MMVNAKLRELFKCMKHTQLVESVKALEVCYDMDGLTYTQAANHLTAAVSKLPDYQMACQVSNVKTGRVQVDTPLKSPDELPSVPTFQSKSRHSSVTPEDLSEHWFIGLKKAKDTIKNTTQ